jgi:hypothetical protein
MTARERLGFAREEREHKDGEREKEKEEAKGN